jgi:hypothetical protein
MSYAVLAAAYAAVAVWITGEAFGQLRYVVVGWGVVAGMNVTLALQSLLEWLDERGES